jgi:hypothetical protein
MKKLLQWIENKADALAQECTERGNLQNAFMAGAAALAASFFLPITPLLGIGIMSAPVATSGLARAVRSVCRLAAPKPARV